MFTSYSVSTIVCITLVTCCCVVFIIIVTIVLSYCVCLFFLWPVQLITTSIIPFTAIHTQMMCLRSTGTEVGFTLTDCSEPLFFCFSATFYHIRLKATIFITFITTTTPNAFDTSSDKQCLRLSTNH